MYPSGNNRCASYGTPNLIYTVRIPSLTMDYKSVVYNAARDGNLIRLKMYLHSNKGKDELLMLVGAKTSGATPLIIACRNGHYDVVEFLVDRCQADIEQSGSVSFDGETIEGAPPLWCAAAAGHLNIVQLLIKRGADVNSRTRTNSTPLRAACFDGHLEIVKYLVKCGGDVEVANRHGHTCLMIACFKGHLRIAKFLLSLGANVNRKTVKGNTAVHDCAESGSLEILKLLIEHGATMDVDSYGMTPVLAAASTGHKHIVEYLIKQTQLVARREQIDSLELLGATFVDKKRDMIGALELWKRAIEKRYNEDPIMPKMCAAPVAAYDDAIELTTVDALDELMADPDDMRMQALVIRERILGPAHPDTSYFIRYRGAVYADAGKFQRCIQLWNYALDMQQTMLERLNPMTQSSLLSFAELFSFMMGEEGKATTRGRIVPPLQLGELLRIFRKAVKEAEHGHQLFNQHANIDLTYLTRVLVISLHLACLLTKLGDYAEKARPIRRALYDLVKLKIRGRGGRTVLHLACSRDAAIVARYPACQFPAAPLVEALLDVGADPDARDDDGNTPLHLIAMTRPCPAQVVRHLLERGAHMDLVNNAGETFVRLLRGQQAAVHELVNVAKYTRLSCMAARVIQQFRIPHRGLVPQQLVSFIHCH